MSSAFLMRTTCARIPTDLGQFQLCHYADKRNDQEHLALILGNITGQEAVLTRVHSECFTGDVMGSRRCDCGAQLHASMRLIAEAGAGILIYLRQEGRGIGLEQKLRAYNLQDQGYDTVEANLMLGHQADEREYSVAAAILADQNVASIHLMTNNPGKIEALQALGIHIRERVPLETSIVKENAGYLFTKVQKMRHMLSLPTRQEQNGLRASDNIKSNMTCGSFNEAPANAQAVEQSSRQISARGITAVTAQDNLIREQLDALDRRADAYHSRIPSVERRSDPAQPTRPFITLTYAQTLDGSIAEADGSPMTISGAESMRVTHLLRTRHDAILVGIGTVLADNPRLTARLVAGEQPQPVILDTQFRFPKNAALLRHPKGVWIATHVNGCGAPHADRLKTLHHKSTIKLVDLPLNEHGHIDLQVLLEQLAKMGVRRLMVEGGATVIRSFLNAELVDYLIVTIAPRLAGGRHLLGVDVQRKSLRFADGAETVETMPLPFPTLTNVHYTQAGQDTILWAQPEWSGLGSSSPDRNPAVAAQPSCPA